MHETKKTAPPLVSEGTRPTETTSNTTPPGHANGWICWPFGMDFESQAHAALYWASLGFKVRPKARSHKLEGPLTRNPESIRGMFRGPGALAAVEGAVPAGVIGFGYDEHDIRDRQRRVFETPCHIEWQREWPHAWTDVPERLVPETLTIRTMLGDRRRTVRLYAAPDVTLNGHNHIPAAVLTTLNGHTFELPSSGLDIQATGKLQPLPEHLRRLLDPEPLPCREQDDKGHPCEECKRYRNERSADYLAPRWASHVMGVAQ